MAIQKKGLLIGGIIAVIIAAGGICAAVLPDALHKEESSISNRTVTTTAAPASTDTENSDQAPETYQSVLSEYYTAFIQNQPDTLYRLMAPPAYWDYYMEHYNKTKEDVISTYQQAITNTMASWKQQCGDDVTVSFAIKGMSEQSQDFLTEWTDDWRRPSTRSRCRNAQRRTHPDRQQGHTDRNHLPDTDSGRWFLVYLTGKYNCCGFPADN